MAIGEAGIDQAVAAGAQNLERVFYAAMDSEVTTEAVARATGDESEDCGRVDESCGHLVQGAVASNGHDEVAVPGEGLGGEFGGMFRMRGDHDLRPMGRGERLDAGEGPGGAAGAGIDDEARLHPSRQTPDAARGERRMDSSPRATAQSCFGWGLMKPTLHVLTGCTAVGKTEWALRWAEARGAEIVSCDSLLFYRGLDIGTAKPTALERTRVPHHLIDVCAIDERMDVTHYVTHALRAVREIGSRGRVALVVGGSGFYLKSFFAPVADDVAVPAWLRVEVAGLSQEVALERLRGLNPAGLGSLDVANPRRVTRALERCLASGRTMADLAEEFARQPGQFAGWAVELTRLERPPEELAQRIEERVAAMLREGLVDEVRRALAAGLRDNPSAARAIGYREVIDFLDGKLPESALADEIAKNTRALVKKQRTWFRTQLPPHREVAVAGLTVEGMFGT